MSDKQLETQEQQVTWEELQVAPQVDINRMGADFYHLGDTFLQGAEAFTGFTKAFERKHVKLNPLERFSGWVEDRIIDAEAWYEHTRVYHFFLDLAARYYRNPDCKCLMCNYSHVARGMWATEPSTDKLTYTRGMWATEPSTDKLTYINGHRDSLLEKSEDYVNFVASLCTASRRGLLTRR
jgi:hypothetical protein